MERGRRWGRMAERPRAARTACRSPTPRRGAPAPRHEPRQRRDRQRAAATAGGSVSGGVRIAAAPRRRWWCWPRALAAYAQLGAGWGGFAALFLLPDLSLLGYLARPRVGALAYNAAHSYLGAGRRCSRSASLGAHAGAAWRRAWSGARTSASTARWATGSSTRAGFGATHLGPHRARGSVVSRADPRACAVHISRRMPRILLIDDDEHLAAPLATYFARFDCVLDSALRPSEGLARLRAGALRRRDPRRDAARDGRLRAVPRDPQGKRHPDRHADRARRRDGPRGRPRARRRRLPAQALRAARTGGARADHPAAPARAAPRRAASARCVFEGLAIDLDTREVLRQGERGRADRHRVRAARAAGRASPARCSAATTS